MIRKITAGSWKTTSAGFATIAFAIIDVGWAVYEHTLTKNDLTTSVLAILAGLGLLFARDNDKSSEDVGAKQ